MLCTSGSLTGGYVNTSRCRLEVYKTRSTLNAQVSEKEKELADCRAKLQQVEGEVNQLLSEIQRTETKNSKSKVIIAKLLISINVYVKNRY